MLENFTAKLKKMGKKEQADKSKNAAKERLHLVLMQDRAHVSADFLDMMKQEIVDVIKKYIDVDENEMDVKLENKVNEDGTSGAPALYANIPIVSINEEKKKESQELAKSKQNEQASIEEKARELMEKKRKAVSAKKASIKKDKEDKEEKIVVKKVKKDDEKAIEDVTEKETIAKETKKTTTKKTSKTTKTTK